MIKKNDIYNEDDWELLAQYIRLVIEANHLPKWGHYEVISNDLSNKEKEKWKK